MKDNKAILSPGGTYHIYNRANGSEHLFLSDENYRYFLRKYDEYVEPIADTFCYCLMPNHFHFLIRIKEEKEVESVILKKTRKSSKTLQGFQTLEGLAKWQAISSYLSQQFSHFFNGYTQAFNKQQNRKGNLFMHTFKRKQITDEAYLRKLIHYIHHNPMASGLAQSLENWEYSSYKTIVSKGKTKLQREEAILFFNDIENFIYCHREPPNITGI